MKNNFLIYVLPCLMMGLYLNSIGQNRYHVDETHYFEPGEYQEHIYDPNNDINEWVTCPVTYRSLKADNEGVNGIVFDTLNNGQLLEESHWKNGTLNGVKKTWFKSGVLKYEGRYIDGAPDGIHQSFYRSGSPKHQSNSVNGDFHGKYIEWYEYSKNIKSEWIYVNGKKHGQQKEFSSSGKLQSVEIYDNGGKITP
jgi:antitoxin component YwqK of YwqJK toxin-antitoxin module